MKTIPQNLLEDFQAHRISTVELAKKLGVHPATIRRNIKRSPKEKTRGKSQAIAARRELRRSKAHLPIREIMKTLFVSESTAYRIKKNA